MVRTEDTSTNGLVWYAVVDRGENTGSGRAATCGPMHAARDAAATTACGLSIDPSSGRRALPQVTFASILDAAATMVCGTCRRTVQRPAVQLPPA